MSDGPFPGLLLRTPYGKPEGGMERYVRAGYVVMAQDTRGRLTWWPCALTRFRSS